MSEIDNTIIGYVTDVRGNSFSVVLNTEDDRPPIVTIADEDIQVGRLGSYVAVRQNNVDIIAIVSRMSDREKPPATTDLEPGQFITLSVERTIEVVPLGSVVDGGEFERGVSIYPTTGAEVHAIGSEDIAKMFKRFQDKGYDVGHLPSNPSLKVCLDPTAMFGRHFAVLGQTGAGKSWTVATLVQRAVATMPNCHIVILDLHGEYCWKDGKGKECSAFQGCNYRHVDARDLEMPYWLMTYSELCDLLIDQTDYSAHNQTAAFRDALRQLKEEESRKPELKGVRPTLDTPIYFDIMELREIINTKNGVIPGKNPGTTKDGPLTGKFDNFLMRLDSRLNDIRYDFLLKPKVRNTSSTLSDLLRDFIGLGTPKSSLTIIDLSSVPFDVRPPVAAQIGRLAFEFNYWNPQYREFPILLICEEAHIYIPRSSDAQYAGSRKSMERIAKEGRKYGVGLGVVSQRPHEVSETVLSQCGTFLCLRITNPGDQNYVRALVPEVEGDLIDILAGLGRGECMALGEAVPVPTRLRFHPPSPAPNSDDIDFYANWKAGLKDINVNAIVERWRKQER